MNLLPIRAAIFYRASLRQNDGLGLVIALGGFALLTMGDAVVKTIAGAWPGTAVALTRYTIGAIVLGLLLARKEGRAGFRVTQWRWHLLRGFGVALGTVAFFSAVFLMPLAEATTITFTGPVMTALLAPLVLNERLRPIGFVALALALAGTVLVLRPTFAELGWPALLPLIGAFGMSLVMIGNRAVAGTGSPLAMQVLIAGLAVPVIALATLAGHLSGIPQFHVGPVDWTVLGRCAIVAGTATTAHWLIFMGTERASASRVAPMTYVQLLVALLLGWLVFGDVPDWIALAGASIIIAAGLLLWWSGRQAVAMRGNVPTVERLR